MEEDTSNLNPWARADMERPTPETTELVPPERREEYTQVLGELNDAGAALNESIARFAAAQALRHDFFAGLAF